ncbi:AAA family ATPase [Rhizobium sp. 2YAF20]|uniref:AAA family ATPase n=1 Tax=Rhizobium sp. 2YAF20 TaxID=3233027 RepID=UPI003F99503C
MPISTKNETICSSVLHYALFCTFTRALNAHPAFALGATGLVVMLTPPGQPARDYGPSAGAFLYEGLARSDYDTVGFQFVAAREKPEKIKSEFGAECARKVRAIVISETDNLPVSIMVAADVIVQLEPVSENDLRDACRDVLNLKVSAKQAKQLLAFPQELMVSALRRNRTTSETIRRLKTLSLDNELGTPIEEPTPRLEELHGYGDAKKWGLQLAADLKLWERGKLKWSEVDRGLLLSGPPGVGKTIFAKALAQTCGVYFVATSVAQWQSKGHLGDLLKAMRSDFATAINNVPSIIFLDELDSIGDRNTFSDEHASYSVQVVNGLLETLDGTTKRDGLIVIGATNHPDKIDPAIRRPGRLDRHVVIGMPDEADRVAILRQLLGVESSLDLEVLGPITEAMSGADLAQVVRDAKRMARRQGRAVALSDLTSQLPQLIPVTGAYRRSVAVHEAGHTVVGIKLAYGKFHGVYIGKQLNPRFGLQSAGGAAFEIPVLSLRNDQRYRDEICVCLAGIAAEKLILGSHGDGAGVGPGSDLARATSLALDMETKAAMGDRLFQFGRGTSWDAFGPQQVPWLMDRVNQILREQLDRARDILERERALLHAVSEELDTVGAVPPSRLDELQQEIDGSKRNRPVDDGSVSAPERPKALPSENGVAARKEARP